MVTRRRAVLSVGLIVVVGAIVAGVGVWYFFFSSNAPGAASIDQAADVVASGQPVANTSGGSLDGTWNIDTTIGSFSDYSDSYAGFRVDEVLQNLGKSTAIGRTPNVAGQLTLSGQTLTATSIHVDVTSIRSDQPRRDPAIQRTLETSNFPTAEFNLSAPIALPEPPTEGATFNLTGTGNMTIHGVTQPVSVTLQAKLVDGVIVVVGSTPFSFSDYGMSAPQAPIVLSVDDHGTLEFQLFFSRSAS
jgi:polyisoprenoid-binding protein YceI